MDTRPRASSLNPYATAYVPLSKRQVESKSVKAPQSGGPSSSSYKTNDKRMMDEQSDMELEYLQMIFPGLSIDSVTDVFFANRGDLDATIDMLNHLEKHTDDSDTLPDSLDIGDFLDSGHHQGGLFASHQSKISSNDASASTSKESSTIS